MGRKGISLVDVIRATVSLRKQGRIAGPFNLRLELGRGSYATIGRHLRRLALTHTSGRHSRAYSSESDA
ncbi:hypothetical protein J2X16_002405 [Pelomonas aquatica]|uniref:KfrA N-terminal DNA-binding domain-containing protein n=1 Tax=Pelomonas aquatica TaxID=431058 RepID=A0ABU1Z8X9_9BURK|nr:hypothetical protein [Pelomonas aquatica]